MDWDDEHDGLSGNTFGLIFMVLLGALWLGVRAIFFGEHVSLHDAGEVGILILGFWGVGEWFEKNRTDRRKMHEAIDLIEQKLDEVLEIRQRY